MSQPAPITLKLRSTGAVIATAVKRADSFGSRLRGLLFRPPLTAEEGLIITKCNQVHMFFMGFPIDVVFCSADYEVLRCYPDLKPWRITSIVLGATMAIELAAGTIDRCKIAPGDTIEPA